MPQKMGGMKSPKGVRKPPSKNAPMMPMSGMGGGAPSPMGMPPKPMGFKKGGMAKKKK